MMKTKDSDKHSSNHTSRTNLSIAFSWEGVFPDRFSEQIRAYVNKMVDVPATIPAQIFLDYFKRDDISEPSLNVFNSLTDEQKTFISMLHVSGSYTHLVSIFSARVLKALQSADSGEIGQYRYTEQGLTYTARFDGSGGLKWEDGIIGSYETTDPEYTFIDEKAMLKQPTTYNRPLSSFYNTPPLSIVFFHLTDIKLSFFFLLEWFYNYLEPIEGISFDYKTYNCLYESVDKKDFELFSSTVYKCSKMAINQLSIMVELFYPTLLFFERQTVEYSHILDNIRNDLYNSDYKIKLAFSPISVFFNFLIIYIFKNGVERHLSQTERVFHYLALMEYSNRFTDIFLEWVENETEEIADYFRNNHDSLLNNTIETTKKNVNSLEDEIPQQQGPGSNSGNEGQPVNTMEQLKDNDQEPKEGPIETPDFIKISHGQIMLEKLVEGLVEGHKDETLGYFTPLVTSKTGEDREAIKKKLICLFTGEGINDESIKWPYDLKWNDKANSLKLLVYLLLYEGIVLSLSDAVDENNYDGICEKIKTNFTGKHVWNIVGNALSYKSLRNKAKIPKESNISLMKKLASFYIDCQKLDD